MEKAKEVFYELKQKYWVNNRNRTGIVTTAVLIIMVVFLIANYYEKTNNNDNPPTDNKQTTQNENNQNSKDEEILSSNTSKDFTSYTVLKGDSLWSIAEDKLNDPFRWKEIADLNQLQRNDNGIYALEIGQMLKIPAATETTLAQNATPDELAQTAIGEQPTVYTVTHGDTLWDIAVRVYGDGSKWHLIFEANTLGRLPDGSPLIHSGNQLICPALPAP